MGPDGARRASPVRRCSTEPSEAEGAGATLSVSIAPLCCAASAAASFFVTRLTLRQTGCLAVGREAAAGGTAPAHQVANSFGRPAGCHHCFRVH